jgi:hypothetical protein
MVEGNCCLPNISKKFMIVTAMGGDLKGIISKLDCAKAS